LLDSCFDPVPGLRVEKLGVLSYGVYCGSTHPLAARTGLKLSDVLSLPFVGPTSGEDDNWPPDVLRNVAVRTPTMQLAVDICASGELLAALPDVVARMVPRARLVRLPGPEFSTRQLLLIQRRPVGKQAEHPFMAEVRSAARSALRTSSSERSA
jgi:DNA-binding transcriptional LysR family regulator